MSTTDPAPDASLTLEIEQRLALITSRYPDRFDAPQIVQIRARIERSIRLGRSLRTITLANGDALELIMATLPPRTTGK